MNKEERISHELHIIDSLLQDEQYAADMAAELDAAYYRGTGQKVPPFLTAREDSLNVSKPVKEEKIATNIAEFYALECGLGLLCAQTNTTVYDQLQKILADQVSDSAVLLLKRFANATWKAGQPFKGMARIKKANFISSNELPADEVEKDLRQIKAAAIKFSQVLRPGTMQEQMQQVSTLLRDTVYTMHMAAFIDSMYYIGQKQPAPPFITPGEESAVKQKSVREEKIAMNLAGFYATECATNYLVTTTHKTPSEILQSLVDGSMSKQDEELYARFANATWKAGQPFRSLNRISRDTFTPFYFLTKADIDKDLVQVRAAAQKLLLSLK
ncbi:MAG TPA: hypothetical protein PKM63_03315 [Panacibacter sp.]|nr:hypothetical protein [Panacibacter sp.]HNP43288.1 hypothetical protein [Panacibacter sp.]